MSIRSQLQTLLLLVVAAGACRNSAGPDVPPRTHPTGAQLTAVPLTGRPHGVTVASNGTFYVSQIDGNTITRGMLTGTGHAFAGYVPVGDTPAHVAIDPGATFAYTTNQYGNSVSVVDAVTNTLVGSVALDGGGFNLLVSPDGRRVWATSDRGTLHAIDAATRQVTATIPVGAAANGLAYDDARATLYVSSIFSATITAIDVRSNAVKRTYSVGGRPQRLALSADGAELYVASEQHGLEVVTLETGGVLVVSAVRAGAVGLALSPDDAHLYVTNPRAGEVYVVDRGTRQVIRVHRNMGSPRNVAFDHEGTTAIVTDETGYIHFIR